MELFAIRECWHNGHFYKTGNKYFPTQEEIENDTVPRHFVSHINDHVIEKAREEDHLKTVNLIPKKEIVEDDPGKGKAKGKGK